MVIVKKHFREPMVGVNRYAEIMLLSLPSLKSEADPVCRTSRECRVSA